MAKLVSKVYGDALFEAGLENDTLPKLEKDVEKVKKALLENPEFDQLMMNPKVDNEEKIHLIEEVFKTRVSEELTGLLVIVVTKGRYGELAQIFEYFLERVKEYKKIGVAYVTSAVELSKGWKKKIESRLLETTDYAKMEMHYKIDESLIGGLVIRLGDRVVDTSLRSHLTDLTGKLMNLSLEA